MMSRTHVAFGVTATIILINIKTGNRFNYWELIPGAVIGSTMPDVDTNSSWMAQSIPLVDDVLRKTGFLKHRGITHSIWALIIMIILAFTIRNDFMLGFAVGYTSHIVLDKISGIIKITCKCDKKIYNIVWILNTALVCRIIF